MMCDLSEENDLKATCTKLEVKTLAEKEMKSFQKEVQNVFGCQTKLD